MSTIKEIAYSVREILRGGPQSDDSVIENDYLYFLINNTRSEFIKQQGDKLNSLSEQYIQTINCVDLIKTDRSACCNVTTDCLVLKSSKKLPSTIDTGKKDLITFVGSLDRNITFQRYSPLRAKYQKYSRYTGNLAYFYILNDYLYVENDKYVEKVRVEGIFEDPLKLADLNDCSGNLCYDLEEDPYPIPNWMVNPLVNRVIDRLSTMIQVPRDIYNDAADNESNNTEEIRKT